MKDKIIQAFNFRHACKEFDETKKIPQEDFDFILETARLSPSSFGFEPWKFLVIQNTELRQKLKEFTWGGSKQFPTASHLIIALVKKSHFMKYGSDYIADFMKNVQELPENIQELKSGLYKDFQEKDFSLFESERAMTDWAAKQTYLPLANMMTAAAMIGIDSCPIEGFSQQDITRILEEEAGVNPEHYSPVYMLTFGYRETEPRPKTRQTIENVVEWY